MRFVRAIFLNFCGTNGRDGYSLGFGLLCVELGFVDN